MNSFLFCVNVLFLIYLWVKVWQPHLLNVCRDGLYSKRSAIRQYFIDHSIGLDSEAYKFARDFMNIQARYADHASLFRMFIANLFLYNKPDSRKDPIESGLHELPKEHYDSVKAMILDGVRVIADYMLLRSFIMCLLILVVSFIYIPFALLRSLCEKTPARKWMYTLQKLRNAWIQKGVEHELKLYSNTDIRLAVAMK
jgi:hypothetical protein